MVYKFDPVHFNGTIFLLDDTSRMAKGSTQLVIQGIPASYFPKALTFVAASSKLPDMFHMSRGFFVFSERARVVMEDWAPGQLEFIPVACNAAPKVAATLDFAHAYYFINVLGRAERLQWRRIPSRKVHTRDDGTELFMPLPGLDKWELRERAPGEPLIWRDTPWRDGNREYAFQSDPFIEDVLWRELDANFPDQLHPLRVGWD